MKFKKTHIKDIVLAFLLAFFYMVLTVGCKQAAYTDDGARLFETEDGEQYGMRFFNDNQEWKANSSLGTIGVVNKVIIVDPDNGRAVKVLHLVEEEQ